jgi:hypothetical protein
MVAMSRTKLIGLCLLTTFALGAATASSASAFAWWVEKEGGGEEILAEGVKEPFNNASVVHKPFVLKGKVGSVPFESSCSLASYEGGYIEGLVGFGATAISFEKCSVSKPVACKIEGEKIKTVALVGNIKKASGTKVEFELKAVSGTTFTKFKLLGAGCPATVEVAGTARGEVTNPKEISKEKSFQFQTKEKGLTISGEAAESTGEPGYSSGRGWGAH